jgi:hypothetical protein
VKIASRPAIDRVILGKVLRDLTRLPPGAGRLAIEAAVWRSIARHARALSSEEIAEVTWQILDRLSQPTRNAA